MRHVILMCLVTFLAGSVDATDLSWWRLRHAGTFPCDFQDVSWSPSQTKAVAVGTVGLVAWSHDGGLTWTATNLTTWADATGAAWQDDDNVWVTATMWSGWSGTGVLLHSANGGETWQVIVDDHPTPLTSIAFADTSTGFAGTPADGLLVTRDGGTNWAVENHPGATLATVSFSDSMIGHASGSGLSFGLSRTTNAGLVWSPVYDCPDGTITALSFPDAVHGFLASPVSVAGSTDAGATWSPLAAIPQTWIVDLEFADALTGWLGGSHQLGTDDSGVVLSTTDGGLTWSDTGLVEPDRITALATNSAGSLLAAGEGGTLLSSQNGGATWTDLAESPANHFRAVQFDDSSNGWAVGPIGTVHRTADRGARWTSVGGLGTWTLEAVVRADSDTLYACGSYALIASDNNGGSWEMRYTYLNCHTLWFFDELNGLAGTQYGVLWTDDGGFTWTMAEDGGTGSGGVFDLHFFDASHGFAAAGLGKVLETVDGGRSWTTVNSEPPGQNSYLHAITFTDGNTGVAVGEDGLVVTTSDGGGSWTHRSSGTTEHLNDVSHLGPLSLLAVGNGGTILTSEDGGISWTQAGCPSTADLWALDVTDLSVPLIAGDWGTVLVPALPGLLFEDGFESGNAGNWSASSGLAARGSDRSSDRP